MTDGQSLIAELEDAIQSGNKDKRVDTLRRITDLFVADSDRLNDRQIDVFDDVIGHLIKRIEDKALAELSRRLGPVKNAPNDVVRRLARHDDIAVAEPILTQSKRLTDGDLIEIAQTKTQAHLLAISGRQHINESVTDALLERGDEHVFLRLAGNHGANFSEGGFANLVRRSERDERLAERIGRRLDVPIRLFRELLLRATEAVRSRLLAAASPEARAHIQRILTDISEDMGHEAGVENEQDYAEAYARALEIRRQGQLSGVTLFEFARAGRRIDVIAGLALLCAAPQSLVDKLLQIQQREAFLIPCKAANLDWPTVRAILNCCSVGGAVADQDLDQARSDYTKLSQASAQRVLRFWQVRQAAVKDDAGAGAVAAAAAAAR